MDTPTWDNTAPIEQAAVSPTPTDVTQASSEPTFESTVPMSGSEPTWDSTVDVADYETPGQLLKTAAEGVAEGVLGPLAPIIEKNILGVEPEEILARRTVNPVTHGASQAVGLGASLFTGIGEAALLAKAGSAATKAAGLAEATSIGGKILAAGVNEAAQSALLQGSDEITKMIINDPTATAQNAVANIGLAAALGGTTGAAIGSISPLWKAAVGDKASKFVQEAKDELIYMKNNPNPIEAATQELADLHGNTQALKESLYHNGLKGDLIKESLPQITPENTAKLTSQFEDVISRVRGAASEALDSVDTKVAAPYLEQRAKDFETKLLKAQTYEDGYNALNSLKQDLASDAAAGKAFGAGLEATERGKLSAKLAAEIRPMLEDKAIWGEAGNIQQTFNKAFSDFSQSKAEKDFMKTFTREVGGQKVLDEAKLSTFVNQMDKPQGKLKNEILDNYIKEHEKFANTVNGLMSKLGKDELVPPVSLGALTKLRGELTPGAKVIQQMMSKELDKVAGRSVATGMGGALGSLVGAPGWGALIGEQVLGSTAEKAMAGLAKKIMDNPSSSKGFKSAMDLTIQAIKGEAKLNKAIGDVISTGTRATIVNAISQSDRDKLDKVITKLGDAPGRVVNLDNGHLGHYIPDHQTALTQSSVSAGQYLHDLKPKPYRSSPLDAEIEPTPGEIARYNRALDIAQQPSIVLQHVKDGTLLPTDIQDLHTMYPALYQQMSNKLGEELAKAQAQKITIPYRTKVGVSLFLGQPLDSSMTPSSIQAAQPIPTAQQQPQIQGPGKSMKSLGKSNSMYMTPNQASEAHKAEKQ